ncbi:type II toxin-antitoxin system PemK/MazF family toxin [Micromonospora sp. WMMD1120]|uniref:type II toxin-antitoxin system PemK/MazF family toxin n=1 Tax=Micromonospora sp. WMMD1120 TaxID=3016106 RepID=UPI002418008A|nr:type II toxin-antitoxin system PemK/MazF family toxin [Micromonospora sp. WMMD1120]MDG4808241.1 type II toxin-antitoxin system PemK/MazF family toxin [Micromonospora sp. WMMD1120]
MAARGWPEVEVRMAEALLWSVAIPLTVAAGWAWNSWRRRVTERRPGTRPERGAGDRRPTPPRPRNAGRPTAEPRSARDDSPAPGEIWWADVPYADGSGSKVRPCLVLRVDSRGADVLKITSQDKSDRDDHVRIPTREWDPGAEHDSYLSLAEPIRLSLADFADHAGRCDADLWREVRSLRHLRTP